MSECVICSDVFDKCTITKCGHSFCEVILYMNQKCILGCINLHNCCPTCKAPLKKEGLIKNYLIDHIISRYLLKKIMLRLKDLKKNIIIF